MMTLRLWFVPKKVDSTPLEFNIFGLWSCRVAQTSRKPLYVATRSPCAERTSDMHVPVQQKNWEAYCRWAACYLPVITLSIPSFNFQNKVMKKTSCVDDNNPTRRTLHSAEERLKERTLYWATDAGSNSPSLGTPFSFTGRKKIREVSGMEVMQNWSAELYKLHLSGHILGEVETPTTTGWIST